MEYWELWLGKCRVLIGFGRSLTELEVARYSMNELPDWLWMKYERSMKRRGPSTKHALFDILSRWLASTNSNN